MLLLFKYDFPDSGARTLKQILDSIAPPAGYYGFDRAYFALAAGSGPVNIAETGGFTSPLSEKTARQRNGQSFEEAWPGSITVTPGTGASWSILVCVAHTGQGET